MCNRRWWGLPIAILWLGVTTPALPQTIPMPAPAAPPGQSHPSHFIDLNTLGDFKDLEAALRNRLNRAETLNAAQQQLLDLLKNKKLLDQFNGKFSPEVFENARKQLAKNPDLINQLDLKKILGQAQKDRQPGQGPTPEQFQEVKKLMEQLYPKGSTGPGTGLPTPDKIPPPPNRFGNGDSPPPNQPRQNPGDSPPLPPALAPSSPGHSFEDFVKRQLGNWAEDMQNWDYSGEEGTALRDALQQLSRTNFARDGMSPLEGKFDFLPNLGEFFSRENFSGMDLSPLRDLRMSDLPRWHMPSLGSGPSLPSMPSMPSMPSLGGGPSVSPGEAGTGLMWVAVVVLLVVLAWKGREWYQEAKGARGKTDWQPGAWPVAPGKVTTRSDLVRAFEYLALLCLGPTAGTRNHHDLADQLGRQGQADSPARRQAAESLAGLYEQSRYAPEAARPDEPLPEHDRAAARQALCFLAGVTPA